MFDEDKNPSSMMDIKPHLVTAKLLYRLSFPCSWTPEGLYENHFLFDKNMHDTNKQFRQLPVIFLLHMVQAHMKIDLQHYPKLN
jgi:hypothetical protein